jgi:hypothetical protein
LFKEVEVMPAKVVSMQSLESRQHLAAQQLVIDPTDRHLVDPTGKPLFVVGDSPWSIALKTTPAQAQLYFDDRAARGFNTLIINLIDIAYGGPANEFNELPFTTLWDFSSPNEAYWQTVDAMINLARDRGMYVLACPAYLGYDGAEPADGFHDQLIAAGNSAVQSYGAFLGNRYKNYSNIIWLMGGDRLAGAALPATNAMVAGIKQHMPTAQFTSHSGPDNRPTTSDYNQPWLTLSNTYTYLPTHVGSQQEYQSPTSKPFFHLESWYEGGDWGTQQYFRNFKYWSALGGSFGAIMGNHNIWGFYNNPDWTQNLNSPLARAMTHFKSLLANSRWTDLVPDFNNQLVTANKGSWNSYVSAAKTADGKQAIVYIPGNDSDAFAPPPQVPNYSITVDMSEFDGPVRARWFDPTTGTYSPAHTGSTIPNSGLRAFTAPGRNAANDTDWALKFDTDFVAPAVASSSFEFQNRQAVNLIFSEDLYTTLTDSAVVVTNLGNRSIVPASAYRTLYDRATRKWSVIFKSPLPDGNYRLSLAAASLKDGAGNSLVAHSFDFFTLAGDANRDRTVNFGDLLIVAQNYESTGRTWSTGDFNYDGVCDFGDLLVLATRYDTTLPATTVARSSRTPTTRRTARRSTFDQLSS